MKSKLDTLLWIPRITLIVIILLVIYFDFFSISFNSNHLIFYLIKILFFVFYIFLSFKNPLWLGVILILLCFANTKPLHQMFHQATQGQDIVFILSYFIAGCLFIILPLFFKAKTKK